MEGTAATTSYQPALAPAMTAAANKKRFSVKHTPLLSQVEQRLARWYREKTTSGARRVVTNAELRAKAQQLGRKCELPEDFTYSRGWMYKFKKRYHIDNYGNQAASQAEPSLPREEYVAFPCTLFYRALPDAAQSHAGDKLTIILAVSKDGNDKIDPLVVGREKTSPENFSTYFPTADGRLDQSAFDKWARLLDAKMRRDKKTVDLLVDSHAGLTSSLRPSDGLKNVFVDLVPTMDSAETSKLIRAFKTNYRQFQICHLNECIQENRVPSLSLKEMVVFIKLAWDETSFPVSENFEEEMQEIDIELAHLMRDVGNQLRIRSLMTPQEYFDIEDNPKFLNQAILNGKGPSHSKQLSARKQQISKPLPPPQKKPVKDLSEERYKIINEIINYQNQQEVEEGGEDSDMDSDDVYHNSISLCPSDIYTSEMDPNDVYSDEMTKEHEDYHIPNGIEPNGMQIQERNQESAIENQSLFKILSQRPIKTKNYVQASLLDFQSVEGKAATSQQQAIVTPQPMADPAKPSNKAVREAIETVYNFLNENCALDEPTYKNLKAVAQSVEAVIIRHLRQRRITEFFGKQ